VVYIVSYIKLIIIPAPKEKILILSTVEQTR